MQFKELKTDYENQGKQTLGLQRGHQVSPHLQISLLPHLVRSTLYGTWWRKSWVPVCISALKEERLSRAVEPLGRWVLQKICSWGTSWKRKAHIPSKLWAFCSVTGIWDGINSPWLQFWLNGVCRCAGGWRWVPGPMHRLAQPDVGGHDAQAGSNPVRQHREKSQRGKVSAASVLCAQEVLKSEPAAYERESFFRETTWTFCCWNNSLCWVTWNV